MYTRAEVTSGKDVEEEEEKKGWEWKLIRTKNVVDDDCDIRVKGWKWRAHAQSMTHATVTKRSGTSRGVSHLDVNISNIRKKFLLEAISAFFWFANSGCAYPWLLGVLASP